MHRLVCGPEVDEATTWCSIPSFSFRERRFVCTAGLSGRWTKSSCQKVDDAEKTKVSVIHYSPDARMPPAKVGQSTPILIRAAMMPSPISSTGRRARCSPVASPRISAPPKRWHQWRWWWQVHQLWQPVRCRDKGRDVKRAPVAGIMQSSCWFARQTFISLRPCGIRAFDHNRDLDVVEDRRVWSIRQGDEFTDLGGMASVASWNSLDGRHHHNKEAEGDVMTP